MNERGSSGTVPVIQKNPTRIINGSIQVGTPYRRTNAPVKPSTNTINFVDVNTIPKSSNNNKRFSTQNQSKEICTDCISLEPKIMVLKMKNDQVRKQLIELEEENKMLKMQLNIYTSEPIETSDNIPAFESDEKCKICSVTLTEHEQSTHICINLDEVTCEYCSVPMSFRSINRLCDHLTNSSIHNNEKIYQCNKCPKNFLAAVLLKCHQCVEHPKSYPQLSSKMFQCGKCNESFEQAKELKQHMDTCNLIDKNILQLLYQPLAYNPTIKDRFECYMCKIQMNRIDDLRNHVKQHEFSRQKCKICKKDLLSNEAKQYHLCATIEHSIKCEYCDHLYQGIGQLLTHLECEHPNRLMYKCQKCRKFFPMKQLVDLHEKFNHTEMEKQFACGQCSFKSSDQKRIDRHVQVHSAERIFTCSECGMSFKTAYQLKHHGDVHSDKMIPCPDCPTKWASQYRLNQHRKMHASIKYKCSQCTSTFGSTATLWRHTKIAHGPARKFPCIHCSFKFVDKKGLQKHLKTHSGEKPFECTFCDRKYAYKGDLNKHLQIHVGNNIYTCEQCGMGFSKYLDHRNHTFEHYKQNRLKLGENSKANASNAQ